jgi:tetratricopeptide (TPR) repeat protein
VKAGKKPPKKTANLARKSKGAEVRSRPQGGKGKSSPPRKPETQRVIVPRQPTAAEIALKESMSRFENALELFNRNQFSKARSIFERLMENPARELAERARVYWNICEQRLARSAPQPKTAEELYNYAVSLANQGNPEEAEQHLKRALKLSPQSDYLYYALATTYAQREDIKGALEYLLKAIELNERNRYQAQNDADFANLLEDPRFTELLYPEKPSA